MTPRTFFTTAALKLLNAIVHIIAWWLLMMVMAWGFRQLPAEQYAEGDAISPMFTVLVRTPQGEVLPQRLHNLKSNETLLRQAFSRDDENGRFFSLTPVAPDSFELFVNYDTAQFTQRYRITADGKVVPLHGLRPFFGFAAADHQGAVGAVALGAFGPHQFAAGGAHQFGRFGQGSLKGAFAAFAAAGKAVGQHQAGQHHPLGAFKGFVWGVESVGHGGVGRIVKAAVFQ